MGGRHGRRSTDGADGDRQGPDDGSGASVPTVTLGADLEGQFGGPERRQSIPGRIAAESFDDHGNTTGNCDARYEFGEVRLRSHPGDGDHVAWLRTDQWLVYDVDVAGAGAYELTARVAADPEFGGGVLGVECDGTAVGRLRIRPTDGWDDWRTVTTRIGLAAGDHRLSVVAEEGGWSLDWLEVERPQ